MTTKLPPIHPQWLCSINDEKFRLELSKTLDAKTEGRPFFKARKNLEDFAAIMVEKGMGNAVPKDVLKRVLKRDDVGAVDANRRLSKLAGDDGGDEVHAILAVLAMSRGINSVAYLYWGGTDEVDLADNMRFECADASTEKKAHGIWQKLCESVGVRIDSMFWSFNTDSGAGCGTCYSNDLTINLLGLSATEGEAEYDEDDLFDDEDEE